MGFLSEPLTGSLWASWETPIFILTTLMCSTQRARTSGLNRSSFFLMFRSVFVGNFPSPFVLFLRQMRMVALRAGIRGLSEIDGRPYLPVC